MPEIHIEIRCDGDGFPSSAELAMRRELHEALEEADVGSVVDTGGGMGVMDIYLEVEDVDAALTRARAIVKRLGLANRTIVEPSPALDDEQLEAPAVTKP